MLDSETGYGRDEHKFANILICVSGCPSKMLARTHVCIHTHVGRDDRLDVGVRQ